MSFVLSENFTTTMLQFNEFIKAQFAKHRMNLIAKSVNLGCYYQNSC